MKLADLQPKDFEYEIAHPATGAPLGVKIQLTDPTSPVVVAAQRDFLTALRATAKADLPAEAELLEQALIVRAKAAVAGWESKFDEFFGGPFSKELVDAIFAEPKFRWLVDQLAGAAADRGNFFR